MRPLLEPSKRSSNLDMIPNPSETRREGKSGKYTPVGRVLAQLAQGPGFDPLYCINSVLVVFASNSSAQVMETGGFKVQG